MNYVNKVRTFLNSNWGRFSQTWFCNAIFFPYLTTRAALIVAAFGSEFIFNYTGFGSDEMVKRGWWFTGHKLLDMWARWDSGWYLDIIEHGYSINGNLTTESNLVFYPLFPVLVKGLSIWIPAAWVNQKIYLIIGILLSNLLLLLALVLLYKLVKEFISGPTTAEKTILYLLLFPTGFLFSTFYTESTFLFFSVAAVYASLKKRWWLAGICAGLLALSRPTGILIVFLLGWLYLDSCEWKIRRIRFDILWLGLAPLCWAGFQLYTSNIAGVIGVSILNQQAWNRNFNFDLFGYILNAIRTTFPFQKIPALFALIFLILSIFSFWKLPSKGYGIFAISIIAVPFLSGKDTSMLRYLLGAFPVFIIAAQLVINRPRLDVFIQACLFSLQIVYMVAWFNLYPIV
jgi:Gpi18-like mannosyltransferase